MYKRCYIKVIGLDGKKYTLNLKHSNHDDSNKSALHLNCRKLLRELYPCDTISEEIGLPGSNLIVDFLLPLRKLIIEVQGHQHYKFVPFFHKTRLEFLKSKERDKQKLEFCRINNFIYVPLCYEDSYEQWRQQIIQAYH